MFFADIVPTVLILFLVGSTEHAHSPKAKENDPLNSVFSIKSKCS